MNSILINGEAATTVDANDRGLQYGDGLFETIAYRNGRLELWQQHMQRMAMGCQRLGLDMPAEAQWQADIERLNPAADAVIKLSVTRGVSGRGYAYDATAPVTRISRVADWPTYPASNLQGITARLCETPVSINTALAGIKHLNRLDNVLARNEWNDSDIAEGLMLDHHQHIIEGTMSNVFCVLDDQLYTPSLERAGVAGVMRQQVLTLARQQSIEVNEIDIGLQNFLQMDGVFVTNSLISLWPVTKMITAENTYTFNKPELITSLQQQLIDSL